MNPYQSPIRRAAAAIEGHNLPTEAAATITSIATQLADYLGSTATASAGCAIMEASLGDATVLIEYEHHFGSPSKTSGPPEDCYEGDPEECYICAVLVNGQWILPEGIIAQSVIDGWVEAACEDAASKAQDAKDDYRIEQYRYAQEYP